MNVIHNNSLFQNDYLINTSQIIEIHITKLKCKSFKHIFKFMIKNINANNELQKNITLTFIYDKKYPSFKYSRVNGMNKNACISSYFYMVRIKKMKCELNNRNYFWMLLEERYFKNMNDILDRKKQKNFKKCIVTNINILYQKVIKKGNKIKFNIKEIWIKY